MSELIDIQDLTFGWTKDTTLLKVPSFTMAAGESVFLRGPSGSGKSTFLGLICGVLNARSGQIMIDGRDVTRLSPTARDRLRADRLGVIFQMFNLLPYLSLADNVALPCRLSKARAKTAQAQSGSVMEEVQRLLDRLGLGDPEYLKRPVRDLSIGQQQRAAAARALIGDPALVIADEPSSALDTDARDAFISLIREEAARTNAALLFVSHDVSLADHFDRNVSLLDLNAALHAEAA